MRTIAFHKDALDQYTEWAKRDKKIFERLHRLIVETANEPFTGIGKPEPLRSNLRGYWSRRISNEHRLVYKVTDEMIIIASCKYHY